MLKWLLLPTAIFYGFIIFIRNIIFDLKIIKNTKLSKPVISIGNITSGGTGKTPLTIFFAEEAKKRGLNPGIVSRGYGRKTTGLQVVHNGKKLLMNVNNSGDEPFLMAIKLKNIPIIVDSNRINGAKKLIDDFNVDLIILDDGFQHRYLHRDIDIILINASVNKSIYHMLPLGMLRELPFGIKRASHVMISKGNFKTVPKKIRSFIKNPVQIKQSFKIDINFKDKESLFFAFCGLADPYSFINNLNQMDIKIKDSFFLKDHASYSKKDQKILLYKIKESGVRNLITTEKDKIKLPKLFLDNYNIHVLYLSIKIESSITNKLFDSILD